MKKLIEDKVLFPNGLSTRNRIVLAPMTISACEAGGYVSQADIDYYKRRARSVGMIITGSAYVHPQGQAFPDSFSVADDDKIDGLARLAEAIHAEGALAVLQIYHGGRMVLPDLVQGQPVAPSSVKALHGYVTEPRALRYEEVDEVIEQFLSAIRRAIRAGFDGVELHGANTYLIQQFYSPHSNIRKDKWGGTINNRLRFVKTLVKKAKQVIKDEAERPFLLGYRFSPEEIEEPGIQLQDTLYLLEQLIRLGIDYLHVSISDIWQSSLRDPLNQEPIIHQIVKKIDQRLPLIGVGNIHTAADVEKVLAADIPLVALGKSLLLDPDWTEKVLTGRESEIIERYHDDLQEELKLPSSFVEELRDYLEGNY